MAPARHVGADCISEAYIKPHGRRLEDGKVVCWGKSRDWKLILMAGVRARSNPARFDPVRPVLLETGPTSETRKRSLVADVASRLGIEKLAWLE